MFLSRQAGRKAYHSLYTLFNDLLTVKNENKRGRGFPVPAPKLSAVCNHASHTSQRDREGGGVGVIRRERKSKGREIRRETQTQAAKRTNKPLKAYLKLTN